MQKSLQKNDDPKQIYQKCKGAMCDFRVLHHPLSPMGLYVLLSYDVEYIKR